MKKLLIFTMPFILFGCSQNPLYEESEENTYTQNIYRKINVSYQDWTELKTRHNGNYSYERDTKIKEGFNTSTKIVVENNRVESRSLFEWQTGSTPSKSWHENYAQLGLHQEGAAPVTIDALYDQCKTQVLNQAGSSALLKTDQLNILKQCSYTINQCVSNCTKGIRIQGLTLY
ncbi:hypothetical protein WN093_06415 [Gammaproteobacteria bacterium AS21]